jgi:hypothetical protein
MFQIFRRRHEKKKPIPDIAVSDQYKKHHARRHPLKALRESRSLQNLFYSKKQRSASDIDRYKVIIN